MIGLINKTKYLKIELNYKIIRSNYMYDILWFILFFDEYSFDITMRSLILYSK